MVHREKEEAETTRLRGFGIRSGRYYQAVFAWTVFLELRLTEAIGVVTLKNKGESLLLI